jgi:hypothetical protein
MSVRLEVDASQLGRFYALMFKYADEGNYISFRCFFDDADGVDKIQASKLNGDPSLTLQTGISVASYAANHPRRRICFAPPVATFTNAKGATEKDLACGVALSVELDSYPTKGRRFLEQLLGPATAIVESGGEWVDPETGVVEHRLHAHWRLAEPTRIAEDHARLKHARFLAQRLTGADATTIPLVHPLRWPGSWHRKAEPKLCRLIVENADAELDLDEALERLEEAARAGGIGKQVNGETYAFDPDRKMAQITRRILTGEEYHCALRDLAYRYLKAGMLAGQATQTLRGLMDASAGPRDQRWQDRYNQIPKLINSAQKKLEEQQAQGGASGPAAAAPSAHKITARPTIRVTQGALHELVDRSQVLLAQTSPDLFQYGGQLSHTVRVNKSVRHKDGCVVPEGTIEVVLASKEWLQIELCRRANWESPRVSKDGSIEWLACDPPMKVAQGVLKDPGRWRARVLNGIAEIPILRDDGSVCATPGYDPATGIFFADSGISFLQLADPPDRDEAIQALAYLEEPLKDFPFVEPHHKSAVLAMILTAIIRRQLPLAPAFGVSAREAGTGKGLLVEIMAVIATGRTAPITPFTVDEDEQRKRITSSLLAGHALINIDNVDAPINSAALASLLTSQIWSERILGVSKKADVPSNALIVITGNNLVIEGDMTRRVIPIELDAGCERPELRTFDRNPATWALKNRGALVGAALTILSAWRRAGQPRTAGFRPLGSYEIWSLEIAACLQWLGRPDPMLAMERVRSSDPKRLLLKRILANWYEMFDKSPQTIGAVMQALEPSNNPHSAEPIEATELREALLEVAADARNDQARKVKLGIYLRSNAGRVVSISRNGQQPLNLRFKEGDTVRRAVQWSVELV